MDNVKHLGKVVPISGLRQMAKSVAMSHGDKGAVIVTFGESGVRIGTEGLTPTELREALCVAMHYTFVFEESD